MDETQKRLAEELLFDKSNAQSFIKGLFFGDFIADAVFPYPSIPVNESFIEQVRTFAEEAIDPDAIDRNQEIPQEVKDALAKMGVMGMTVPKEYGGGGMSQTEYCKVSEILAARCGSTALFVNVHQSIGMRALLLFGSEEQKERWLPELAGGKIISAFALTEPNAGSDAANVESHAAYDPERGYVITGRKQWITNGSIAGVLTVMAKTEDGKVSAFLVTPDMAGFNVTNPKLEKVGYRGTWTANLEFRDMVVPPENLLGEKGKGLKVALTVLDYGRTTFGATCTGVAKHLLDLAVRHAKTRYQFNRPLASFGLVKEKISRMSALCYAMDATTYMTAGLMDRGLHDIMLESTMLKVFASDALWEIIYDTMQIYGGRCFFTDAPLERIMRDARLNMIGEGSNEVMRAFIAAVGMRDVGMELKGVSEAFSSPFSQFGKIMTFAGDMVSRLSAPKVPVQSPKLAKEAHALSKAVRRFGQCVIKVLSRYREEVIEHQLDLNRISSAAMELYTTTSVLSKLETEQDKTQFKVGKFYCHRSMIRFHQQLDSLFDREDYYIEHVSDIITGNGK